MKSVLKPKWRVALLFILVTTQSILAQSKADVFDTSKPITWLGLDFSQTKFIGDPTKGVTGNNGVVSNSEFRDSYTVQWNELFIDEMKKYDVAKAVHRPSVKYDIDVAMNANKTLADKNFYSNNPGDFKTINEGTIDSLVKTYNFKNDDGIGLISLSKG